MADTLHHLIVTRVGEVATIALDRPPVNAVDLRVIDEFHEQRPEARTKWRRNGR